MKIIIQKLCSEVTSLKEKLVTEHKVKRNYESIFNEFTTQMERARSSSKSKSKQKPHSSHKHLQRYSYAPSHYEARETDPRRSEFVGS